MEGEFKMKGNLMCFILIGMLLFLGGCMVMPHSSSYGTPIKEDMVKRIQDGKTTKEEIVKWFGIPNIVQKQGEDTTSQKSLPEGAIMGSMGQKFVSQASFELFSSKHKITEDHRIYVYSFTKMKGASVNVLFFGTTDTKTLTDILLILVNEKTGNVEDHIFRKDEPVE